MIRRPSGMVNARGVRRWRQRPLTACALGELRGTMPAGAPPPAAASQGGAGFGESFQAHGVLPIKPSWLLATEPIRESAKFEID